MKSKGKWFYSCPILLSHALQRTESESAVDSHLFVQFGAALDPLPRLRAAMKRCKGCVEVVQSVLNGEGWRGPVARVA